jgi:hypothetical protein
VPVYPGGAPGAGTAPEKNARGVPSAVSKSCGRSLPPRVTVVPSVAVNVLVATGVSAYLVSRVVVIATVSEQRFACAKSSA